MTSEAVQAFGQMSDPWRAELGEHYPLLTKSCSAGSLTTLLQSGERAVVVQLLTETAAVLRQHAGTHLHVSLAHEGGLWCARVYTLLRGLTFVHRELRAERPSTALTALARELEAPALHRFGTLSVARTQSLAAGEIEIVARYEDGRELPPVRGKSRH